MKRVTLYVDDELEALGYDQVRSRVRLELTTGRVIEGRSDVARGHPEKPLSWEELAGKFHDCAALVLAPKGAEEVIAHVARIEKLKTLTPLIKALSTPKRPSGKVNRRTTLRSNRWNRTRIL
jgi:2-methylcitrate dehydratase PrpD